MFFFRMMSKTLTELRNGRIRQQPGIFEKHLAQTQEVLRAFLKKRHSNLAFLARVEVGLSNLSIRGFQFSVEEGKKLFIGQVGGRRVELALHELPRIFLRPRTR